MLSLQLYKYVLEQDQFPGKPRLFLQFMITKEIHLFFFSGGGLLHENVIKKGYSK